MSGLSNLFRGSTRLSRRWKAELDDHVIDLAWAPGGKMLAAASISGPVTLLDVSGKVLRTLSGHGFGTTALSWRRDGTLLATAGQDGKVRLWDPATGAEKAALAGGAAWVEHVAWDPRGDVLASAAGKKLRLWSHEGTLIREWPDHAATISALQWRPGTHELTSATYGCVALWEAQSAEPVRRLEWKGSILALAWTSDGTRLAHGNQDASVHYWLLASGQDLEMAGYPAKVRELCWDPAGRYLATGGAETVTVWDCAPPGPEGSQPLSFEGHAGLIRALAYQARGPLLASGALDGKLLLFQPGKFKRALSQSEPGGPVSRLAWSADDQYLAVGTERGVVTLYTLV